MARSTKLADLMVKETSGVDHPAHLHEGWLVLKSEDINSALDSVLNDSMKETHVELTVSEKVDTTVDIDKAADHDAIRKELADLRKALDDSRRETEALKTVRALEKAVETAGAWTALPGFDPQEFAPVLVQLRDALPDVAQIIEKVLDASARALTESGLLVEVGTSAQSTDNDAWSIIESKANEMVRTGQASDFAKAVSIVAQSDKALYTQYLNEKGI